MKLTMPQLRSIIKEEVTNKKLALARRNRALKEAGGYVTSNMNVEEQLESAVLAYLENKITKRGMKPEDAQQRLMSEVEGSYDMFVIHMDSPSGPTFDGNPFGG